MIKNTVDITQDTSPIDITVLIPLKTNAFLVNKEHIKDDRYKIVMADKYLKCVIL